MALASACVVLPAAAVALMAMALQLSAAAAAAPPAPIGQPGCNTTCGDVNVPYPFGYGPSRCYWPGLNLTCDTSHHSPRLLIGDGTLRVTAMFLANHTVRVVGTGPIINTTGDFFTSDGWNASLDFDRGFREQGYLLSARNELAVLGCNVMATLSADIVDDNGEETTKIVSGCASFCIFSDRDDFILDKGVTKGMRYCTGASCCAAHLTSGGVPKAVQARWLYSGNHTLEQALKPVTVFVTERGWIDDPEQWEQEFREVPLVLDFGVKQDLPELQSNRSSLNHCPEDVHRRVCKSENSFCVVRDQGYTCHCKHGYDGNPYIAGGCQDVDECKLLGEDRVCFGACTNTIGSYYCWCPQGTYGQPDVQGGCVDYNFNKDALSPTVATVPIGTPGCNTTCGDVRVPYPFGFGPSRCYWPRFNLTCDTSHNPPRLLLHDNRTDTLQVVHISLRNSTVHVVHHSSSSTGWMTVDGGSINLEAKFRLPEIGEPYVLSTRNEFIVLSGYDVRATLYGEYRNGSSSNSNSNIGDDSIISRAVCSPVGDPGAGRPAVPTPTHRGYCTSHDGCCHAPIPAGSTPKRVEFKVLNKNNGNHHYGNWPWDYALAFISEVGLTDQWRKIVIQDDYSYKMSSPIVLQWSVKQGLSAPAANNSGKCPADVVSRLCKSKHSECRQENGGFMCHCSKGYDGNPYVADGCQVHAWAATATICLGTMSVGAREEPTAMLLSPKPASSGPQQD